MNWFKLFFLSSVILFSVWSCAKDPCSGVVCKNGGACLDGNCICQMGYRGADCGQQVRYQFVGDFVGDGLDKNKNVYRAWHAIYNASGDSAMLMQLNVHDSAAVLKLAFKLRIQADLKSFLLDTVHHGTCVYRGSGYLGQTISSLSLQKIDNALMDTLNYEFEEMIKQ
ncbi:MAG: hypothetical protein ORN56_10180 [Chitinophagales bacterium]|nr:hypothetical protein [Chitinophagales bacterium]